MNQSASTDQPQSFIQLRLIILGGIGICGILFFWLFFEQIQQRLNQSTLYQQKAAIEVLLEQVQHHTSLASATTPESKLKAALPSDLPYGAWLLNPRGESLAYFDPHANLGDLSLQKTPLLLWHQQVRLLIHKTEESKKVQFWILPDHQYLLAALRLPSAALKPNYLLFSYHLTKPEKAFLEQKQLDYWKLAALLLFLTLLGSHFLLQFIIKGTKKQLLVKQSNLEQEHSALSKPVLESSLCSVNKNCFFAKLLGHLDLIVYVVDPVRKEVLYVSPYLETLLQQADTSLTEKEAQINAIYDLEVSLPQKRQSLNNSYQTDSNTFHWAVVFQGLKFHCSLRNNNWDEYSQAHIVFGFAESTQTIVIAETELGQGSPSLADQALLANQDGIWQWNQYTDQILLNPEAKHILHCLPEEGPLSLQDYHQIIHPADQSNQRFCWQQFINGEGTHYRAEYRVKDKQEQWIWILDRAIKIEPSQSARFGQKKEIYNVVGTLANITTRKLIEQSILFEESIFKEAQEISHTGSWVWDLASDAVQWSDEMFQIYGYAPQDFVPNVSHFIDAADPDSQKMIQKTFMMILQSKQPLDHFETKITRPNGQVRMVEHTFILKSQNNSHNQVVGICKDITEERGAKQRNALLAQVFKSAKEGIIITDSKSQIVEVNHAFTEITGYSAEEANHVNPNTFASGRHDKEFYTQMWKSIQETGSWEGEIWDRRKTGEVYPKYLSVSRFFDEVGKELKYLGIFSDITRLKETEEHLKSIAYFDSLTGLPNRQNCLDQLNQRIKISQRTGHKLGVLYFNMDNFQSINDSLGRKTGDILLLQIRDILKDTIRASDFLSRNHADEFIILLMEVQNPENCITICIDILKKLDDKLALQGHTLYAKASIGISMYPEDGQEATQLMEKADMAMHHAKSKRPGSYHFYAQNMEDIAIHKLQLERDLHQAVKNHEFLVVYQPQVRIADGKVIGLEALVRWKKPDGTMVPPNQFIPFAEDTGIIVAIGEQVLQQACEEFSSWLQEGLEPVTLSVNFSIKQFHQENLNDLIKETLTTYQMPAKYLKVEITESMLMDEITQAIKILNDLREQGVQSSIDDFGTGYSSLSYLQKFPISDLKIDRAFVMDIVNEPQIASAIITLAKSLNLRVIAEGAENYQQLEKLVELGCEIVQGFYFSRPVPGLEVKEILRTKYIIPEDFTPFNH